MRTLTTLLLGVAISQSFAQSVAPELRFEVASVKAANQDSPRMPAGMQGGPGTSDPSRITFRGAFMSRILESVFGLKHDQISGPNWINSERFDILANVPSGATKEQVNEMLRNLLKDRFNLAFHRTKKDIDAYSLVIAKGGPKLKEAALSNGSPAPPSPAFDQDGFPNLPEGTKNFRSAAGDGITRMTFRMSSPTDLAGSLMRGVIPLVDETGLTGKYDFKLVYSSESLIALIAPGQAREPTDAAPDIFTALEKQLGLKLEKRRTQLDVLVIDHLDKRPTED
jgi:uncharacterized protein (TIGR03435 family)